jgi:hypothetical protein
MVLCLWGLSFAHNGEYFLVQYPPEGPGIVVDAEFSDWAGYPEELKVTLDQMYAHAGDELDPDPTDWDCTIMWSWDNNGEYLQIAAEKFDDVYLPSPEVGNPKVWDYDNFEMGVDPDHSGGYYMYGSAGPEDTWGEGGQQYGFMATPEPYFICQACQGATWHLAPPYMIHDARIAPEATGTREYHEIKMMMFNYLHCDPEPTREDSYAKSELLDMEVGVITHATVLIDEHDVAGEGLDAQWKTAEGTETYMNGDQQPDLILVGPDAWDASQIPTAVEPTSWGALKATFVQ